jgi:hypothetical protein
MYFKDFPKILYEFKVGSKNQTAVVSDITRNIRFRRDVLSNVTVYDEYDIVDGETPEIIAEKIYGNAEYHWIIMLANDRYDYLEDFPLSSYELEKDITAKYPGNEYGTHHYEDADGYIVNSTAAGAVSVSNYEYATRKNEAKRRIKIVSPNLIGTILRNFKELL